jgi:DNA-binding transcriptional LysR family regulator
MDLTQLRIIRELAERGSITAVAQALFVTPSAVSQQLTSLQKEIGVPLTQKNGRVLGLTDAGRALATAAAQVSMAFAQAESSVATYLQDDKHSVSIAALHSAGLTYFAPLMRRLNALDGPTLRCTDEDVAQAEFPLLVADYDIVVAHRMPDSPLWPDSVTATALVYEPLDIALAHDHPLARFSELTPNQLANENWISVHEGFPLTGALNRIGSAAGKPLNITHRINEFYVASSIVASGYAVSLMPRYTGAPEAHSGIVLRPLAGLEIGRHIDILTRPEARLRTSVARVITELTALATEGKAQNGL